VAVSVFIGHALLGFALAVLVAEWRGWPSRQALALGVVTGAFAVLPDVDTLCALVAINLTELVGNTGVWPGESGGRPTRPTA